MDRFRFEAFCEEFPFLREVVAGDVKELDGITVKRTDENLLNMRPRLSNHFGNKGGTYDDTDVHFIAQDIIKCAVAQDAEIISNYAHDAPEYRRGEKVIEAILKKNIADKLQYIVVEKKYNHEWSGEHPRRSWHITIYKPPKNTSFPAEIQKAKEKARAEVKAEFCF
jgi:hypothetical protein